MFDHCAGEFFDSGTFPARLRKLGQPDLGETILVGIG